MKHLPHPVDVHVGARIREARKLAGDVSQVALAKKIGVAFQQVQKYESGANRVSASRLTEIADALNQPIEFFFEDLGGAVPDAAQHRRLGRLVKAIDGLDDTQVDALVGVAKVMERADARP